MKASQFLFATLKETPSDADIASSQLMVRAGLIRKIASGLYIWLPMGLRVLQKVERIVREEMQNVGAQEVLMPMTQPAELWQMTGRFDDYGPELLRFKDRHDRDFVLGPTHEEVITNLAQGELRSYKQLPITFFQIQGKFRDEIRPRFGVMRAREFTMKDAYSFHVDQASLALRLTMICMTLIRASLPVWVWISVRYKRIRVLSAVLLRMSSMCWQTAAKTISHSLILLIMRPTSSLLNR